MNCLVAFLWPDWSFALCSGYFPLREAVVNKVVTPPGAVTHLQDKMSDLKHNSLLFGRCSQISKMQLDKNLYGLYCGLFPCTLNI